ncbi:MAG TPA: carbamoyltransferase HypF [Candidatus Bathyarchaeia archaeon]|nr:carbamoyltransferase HypF [Candidatus Bathyarchaeia archaeon]
MRHEPPGESEVRRDAPGVAIPAAGAGRAAAGAVRREVRIDGLVQGVGMRPFVFALATRLRLTGQVSNDEHGVVVEVEGRGEQVREFLERLPREAPPLAVIERLRTRGLPVTGDTGFAIARSRQGGERQALVSPDVATCGACLRELFDLGDRRFLYPFINCTSCGPRFTIVRAVPYDRARTTMAGFAMCPDCAREYHDPDDRRFHAQPIACPACGPRLALRDRGGVIQEGDPIRRAAELLRLGHVVAVKGLGGYHLAVDAANEAACAELRARKHREARPFAVMTRDIEAARRLAEIDRVEAELLGGARRPIVLVSRRADAPLAAAVAPGNRCVGLMLPYTPLHHLLCRALAAPFVLTSGNVSDEPIAYADDDAARRLYGIADFFLTHDRPIHARSDDSVVRAFRGRELTIRRARGAAPGPLALPWSVPRPILACGAELKSTFCLARGPYAFLSQHIGDLESFPTLRAFSEGIEHFRRLLDVAPRVVAHDLHPDYLSTRIALEYEGVERIGVQHHHAHVAACLAENGAEGPAIGVAFDGLGYGTDGTLWGGEFLIADLARFERLAAFEPLPMPGATAAIRQPWRMAAAYLDAAYGGTAIDDLAVVKRNRERWRQIVALARSRVGSPLTSSVGRLFDAVAAIVDLRDEVRYEGQAAIELEQLADPSERLAYRVGFEPTFPSRVRGTDLVRAVVGDLGCGTRREIVAARFHNALARVTVDVCAALRAASGIGLVALSGGVFQNLLLLERTVSGLEERGFRVLTHSRVPPNDGGISFGQVVVAAARTRIAAAG